MSGSKSHSGLVCRLPVWVIAVGVGAWFIGSTSLEYSRLIAERHDPSAMAWTVAFPFMVPVWLIQSAKVVVPVAGLFEFAAWFIRRNAV